MDCNNGRTIDLHIHSTASDGSLQPEEIINQSIQAGLSAVSLTDHDSIDGCREIITTAAPFPIEFVTGVEISAAFPAEIPLSGSLHILGYAIDIEHPELNHHLEELRKARDQRSPRIIQRLNELGFPLTLNEVEDLTESDQVGRPHIARAMKARGWVRSIDEAFDNYLGNQGPAYVEKERLECDRVLELINASGGIAVLAHPGLLDTRDNRELETLLRLLIDNGLKGIEVFYPEHASQQIAFYNELADRYNLLRTGGTDFHGALNPEIKLGTGAGSFCVPYCLYEKLVDYARNRNTA